MFLTTADAHRSSGPRVLHVLDEFSWGGAQRVALDLVRYAAARGIECTVTGRDGPVRAAFDATPGVTAVPMTGASVLAQVRQLRAVTRSTSATILHAHQRREALVANIVGRTAGVPTVEHAHTVLPSLRMRALSFRSDRIFAVSEGVRAMVAEAGAGHRVVLVGNTASRVTTSAPLPWRPPGPTEPLRLVGVGRLVQQKDPIRFVRVIAAVARRRPVDAVWLGSGPLERAAAATAAALDAPVRFIGQSEDVVAALDRAHGLLMTSAWEGLPLVILEAFARRRPVFATMACGGDGVLAAGRACVVPDDTDTATFAASIIGSIDGSDMLQQLERAAAYAQAQSPDRVFGRVLAEYAQLWSGRS